MKKFIDLIISYKFFLFKIFWYEFIYILLGYKGNSINLRKNEIATDTIPCPYLFLTKISPQLEKENITSFIDLGCGNGRVIYFFNKKINIQYTGVELFQDSYSLTQKSFKKSNNIKIINQNFFDLDYKSINSDCYFINDPLRFDSDHNKLINLIFTAHRELNTNTIFVLVNLSESKLRVFSNLYLLDNFKIGSRGYHIYKLKNV